MTVRDPVLTPVAVGELRPTQITVGMREVQAKRKRWREMGKKGSEFLGKHMIPVILGPKLRHYVVDHHHLARALHDEGVKSVAVTVIANLSRLDRDAFWTVMDNRNWMHPFDAEGRRRPYGDIPKSVTDLRDDPFRSLAGELRRAGGFAKDTTPFSEFLWADFLRRRIKRKLVRLQPRDREGAAIGALRRRRLPARVVRPSAGGLIFSVSPAAAPRRSLHPPNGNNVSAGPPIAQKATTSHGGVFHMNSSRKAAMPSAKSLGLVMADVHTGR
jgi:hypothetical protein